MRYFVTSGGTEGNRAPGPVAIDSSFDLTGAVAHARLLLDQGCQNVSISDYSGKSLSGIDLLGVCSGRRPATEVFGFA